MQPQLITNFVAELLNKAGFANMPENFQQEYSEKIGLEVQKRLGLVAIKELSPEAVDKFGQMMAADAKPEELSQFFEQNIPDYEAKVTQTLKDFADEFLASAEKLKNATA